VGITKSLEESNKMNPKLFITKLGLYWFRRQQKRRECLNLIAQDFCLKEFRKWCVRDEVLVKTKENFQMFASPHDYTSYRIFFFGEYDAVMTSFIKAHVTEGATCLDIGAERGWFSLLMGKIVGPKGRVDSFEAFPPNYKKLKANILINKFDWVHSYNIAVSNNTGYANFVPPPYYIKQQIDRCGSGVGYLVSTPNPDSARVPTITLDQHIEEAGINRFDLVKIDVEGSEAAVLEGGQHMIKRFHPKIIIEYNQVAAKRAKATVEELDTILDDFGYDRFVYCEKLERLNLEKWKDYLDNDGSFDVYCLPRR
jgi:FkbM family methyltransferase